MHDLLSALHGLSWPHFTFAWPHIAAGEGLLWPSLRGLPPRGWLLVVTALFMGGLVKGVVSIGVPLVAIPLLTLLLPVKQAVLLLSLPIILGNIPQALEGGKTLSALRGVGFLAVGAVLGIALGVKLLFAIPAHLAAGLAGLILLAASLMLLVAPRITLPRRGAGFIGLLAGFASGLMEGISAVPGPLLATYLIATGATGRAFTKAIALVLIVSLLALILVFGQSGKAVGMDLLVSALAALPVVAGLLAARPLRDALKPALFRALVLAFVIIAAVQMVLRAGILSL